MKAKYYLILIPFIIYGLIVLYFYIFQRSLIYRPLPPTDYSKYQKEFKRDFLIDSVGNKIEIWHRLNKKKPTILMIHGAMSNMEYQIE